MFVLPLVAIRYPAIKTAILSKETNWPTLLGSIALATLANFLIFSSIRHLNASTSSIFEISYPLFVGIFGYLFFRAPISAATVVGGALIFAGSVVIIRFS